MEAWAGPLEAPLFNDLPPGGTDGLSIASLRFLSRVSHRFPIVLSDRWRVDDLPGHAPTWQLAGDVFGKIVHREAVLRVVHDHRGESS